MGLSSLYFQCFFLFFSDFFLSKKKINFFFVHIFQIFFRTFFLLINFYIIWFIFIIRKGNFNHINIHRGKERYNCERVLSLGLFVCTIHCELIEWNCDVYLNGIIYGSTREHISSAFLHILCAENVQKMWRGWQMYIV